MANPYWPFFELVVRTPMLELRLPTDDECVQLAEVAAQGVHPPDFMPFNVPWTRLEPPALQRQAIQHWWGLRAGLQPDAWNLGFMTVVDGQPVGSQAIGAKNFSQLRLVSTGSWLGQAYQGRGIGKEMRTAVLHFAFAGLGAQVAISAAFADNAQSIAVSRGVGYEDNGLELVLRDGIPAPHVNFWMERARWEERRRDDITIEGLEPCLPLLGASEATPSGTGDTPPTAGDEIA